MNPYKILNVKKTANTDTIKGAYRVLAKRYHPDMPDGDAEKFLQLKRARDVLLDAELRKQYDATGIMPDGDQAVLVQHAKTMLGEIFFAIVMQCPVEKFERTDVIGSIRQHLTGKLRESEAQLREFQDRHDSMRKYKEVLESRLTMKDDPSDKENVFVTALAGVTQRLTSQIMELSEGMRVTKHSLVMLDDYAFQAKVQRSTHSFADMMSFTATTSTGGF
jgi:curved DNA-binding protein CbpA